MVFYVLFFFFFKQKTAYEMRISDWSSDVCSSDLLIALMAIFTLGNFLSAIAGDYATLMVARVITSLNHGAFFGVGSVVAASLVAPEKRASAVAAMFMGLTLANVIGVPLAPWIGETFGWRSAFGIIRSEEHTSELQSLMRISYAVF